MTCLFVIRSKYKEPHVLDRHLHLIENFYESSTNPYEMYWAGELFSYQLSQPPRIADSFAFGSFVRSDATPAYFMGGKTIAKRILKMNQYARIIVIVRDPLSRAYSQWNMLRVIDDTMSEHKRNKRMNQYGKSFEDCLREGKLFSYQLYLTSKNRGLNHLRLINRLSSSHSSAQI